MLGREAAQAYLRAVLRICSDGLLAGKPVSLVQDEVRAELTGYLRSARQEMLALALRHAELSVEIAEAARDALEHAIVGAADRCRAAAARARSAEHEADELVTRRASRQPARRISGRSCSWSRRRTTSPTRAEEAAFYATLLPAGQPGR